jgi:hypothetical protein
MRRLLKPGAAALAIATMAVLGWQVQAETNRVRFPELDGLEAVVD